MKPPKKGPVTLDSIIKSKGPPTNNQPTSNKTWNVVDAYSMVTQKPTNKNQEVVKREEPISEKSEQIESLDNGNETVTNLLEVNLSNNETIIESDINSAKSLIIDNESVTNCLTTPEKLNQCIEFNSDKIMSSINNESNLDSKIISSNSNNYNESVTERSLNGNETVTKQSIYGNETVTNSTSGENITLTKRSLNGNETKVSVTKRSRKTKYNGNETVTNSTSDENITVTERSLNGNDKSGYNLLIGNEKKIVDMVFHQCQVSASLITPELNIELIKNYVGPISNGAVKMAVQRVLIKKIIYRADRKDGRAGWVKFGMSQVLYNHLVFRATVTERSPNGNEIDSKAKNNGNGTVMERSLNGNANYNETTSSMYVGKINNNTIHTNQETESTESSHAQDSWQELRDIDFSVIAQFNIRPHVVETFKKNNWIITRDQLEEHMDRFVRYFSEKEFEKRRESIKNPYSFFLGCIKAIAKGEPDPICDVKTPIEIAQQYAIQNKLKAMEIRRQELEALTKQTDMYRDSEFEHWYLSLTDEQKLSIVPSTKIAELGTGRHKILIKEHYTQNVWPDIKHSVLNGSELQN